MTPQTGDARLRATLDALDPAQVGGLGDMSPEQFRAAAHATVDLLADYLEHVEDFAILPPIEPGTLRNQLPPEPPEGPESIGAILADGWYASDLAFTGKRKNYGGDPRHH